MLIYSEFGFEDFVSNHGTTPIIVAREIRVRLSVGILSDNRRHFHRMGTLLLGSLNGRASCAHAAPVVATRQSTARAPQEARAAEAEPVAAVVVSSFAWQMR